MDKYRTIQGDTWDLISFKVFGSELYLKELILANPNLMEYIILPSGLEINVPKLQIDSQSKNLPPWKQKWT